MITVYSIVACHADMVALQANAIRRFLQPSHRFVVVNNDPDPAIRGVINRECERCGVEVLDLQRANVQTGPSRMHAAAMTLVWQAMRGGVVLFIDMDMFPIRPTNPLPWLDRHPVAGVEQKRDVCYPWPGFLIADIDRLPAFQEATFSIVHGIRDTGGRFADYLATHNLDFERIPHANDPATVKSIAGDDYDPAWLCEYVAGDWLHYRNGSDWMGIGDRIDSPKRQWLHARMR